MVRYGCENVAVSMNDVNKANLKKVFDDMCSYITETITKKTFNMKVTMKTYTVMTETYNFNPEQIEMLNQMMESDNIVRLGYKYNK